MPHGMCFLWQPGMLVFQILADALIALAYFSIPLFLVWIVRKRGDLPFSWVFIMFAAFIVSCGTTHLMSIWVIWHPDYWIEGAVKWVTAVSSVGTAFTLVPLTPKILKLRSPAQTEQLLAKLRREKSIARSFQAASLSTLPENTPGLVIDAMYRPAESDLEIGGDWYDAFLLLDGRVVVSIGDVAGKGLEAAVVMSKIRQAIRIAGQALMDPAAILNAADRALQSEYPNLMVTAFVGIFDRAEQTFVYANAAHPGPLVLNANGLESLEGNSLPLGLRLREESALLHSMPLEVGSLFVFYTDGLIEATRNMVAGERLLREVVGTAGLREAAHPAKAIHQQVVGEAARDDVAILTVLVSELDGNTDATCWEFEAMDARAAHVVRMELHEFLHMRSVGAEQIVNAELIVMELLGNVVRHAPGRVTIRIDWNRGSPVLHVIDEGPGFQFHPRLPREILSEGGRGLYLIAATAEEFHVSRRPKQGSHARVVLFSTFTDLRSRKPSVVKNTASDNSASPQEN